MKAYIKLLFLSGVCAGLGSCTDLDTDIDTQYTQLPDNDIIVNSQLEGCYYYMRNEAGLGRNYWEGVMLQGDELMGISFGGGWFDNGRAVYPSQHKLNPDIPGVGIMGDLMSGMTYCNTVIANLGGPNLDDPLVAPVRAARAFYQFMLMDLYGDVPMLGSTECLDADGATVRNKRGDVARWLETELLAIIPDLTEANNVDTYGRPNKWMAEALLAKLYINWPVYTAEDIETYNPSAANEKLNDCIAICDDIIKSGIFSVGKGYRKKFMSDNGVHITDFIYAMPFDPATLGANYGGGSEMDRFMAFCKANGTEPTGPLGFVYSKSTGGNWILVPEAIDRFNLKGDERNEMILVGPQYVRDANCDKTSTPLMYKGAQIDYSKTIKDEEWLNKDLFDVGSNGDAANCIKGAHLLKYPSVQDDYDKWSRKQSNDLPIFRYADILLTKAEAIARGGNATNGATVAGLINEVRDCSGAEHISGTPSLQDILDERGREFICEMWRRNDLIRYGQFENDWGYKHDVNPSAKTELWRRLLPIPTGVMDTNTNWTQNKGYN
ncbi:MAG: RagB/SusD family nutrient uptake outer membrane protein [Lachnospiraceae bacterium]|nr:RagB/SusD family nutrient uptake outer membrane protein [Lachnospiraceae bacterium]